MMKYEFNVMIEESKVEGTFYAYIPALQLGARGDSVEECTENAKDLNQMKVDEAVLSGKPIPKDTAIFEKVNILVQSVK